MEGLAFTVEQCLLTAAQRLLVCEVSHTGQDFTSLLEVVRADASLFKSFVEKLAEKFKVCLKAEWLARCRSYEEFLICLSSYIDSAEAQTATSPAARPNSQFQGEAAISYTVITGAACRLPGCVHNAGKYWENLSQGKDSIVPVPLERWDCDAYINAENPRGAMYVREGGFLDRIEDFDNDFFKISASEARTMDPQQRILLELSYEAFRSANREPFEENLHDFGVLVGCSCADWTILKTKQTERLGPFATANTPQALLANRISYTFNACGPSLTVDSASSSALVAFCTAASFLETRRCRSCLVASSSLMLVPEPTIALCAAGMLAVDARCRPFDAAANGYGRGEGAVAFILEQLHSTNEEDGGRYLAIVRGHMTNHNGHLLSVTAPSDAAQRKLLQGAMSIAKLYPHNIDYFEAHGTGTKLGDTIEFRAIKSVFASSCTNTSPLSIGSSKSNIGHLEGCAGAAGLLKAILVLCKRSVPPTLHFKQINPLIDDQNFSYQIPTECTPLKQKKMYYACVSSFGLGGCNAHVIIERSACAAGANFALNLCQQWNHTVFPVFHSALPRAFSGLALHHTQPFPSGAAVCRRHSATIPTGQKKLASGAYLRRFSALSSGMCAAHIRESSRQSDMLNSDISTSPCGHNVSHPHEVVSGDTTSANQSELTEAFSPSDIDDNSDSKVDEAQTAGGYATPPGQAEHLSKPLVQQIVTAALSAVLKGCHDLPVDAPLKSLGLDSLGAVEFRDSLQEMIGEKLPSSLAFDHPTIEDVCSFLLQKMSRQSDNLQTSFAEISTTQCNLPTSAIAIVGLSCRFPRCPWGSEPFWEVMKAGIDCVDEIPSSRFSIASLYDKDPDAAGKMYTREAGMLSQVDLFDNAFFKISEAEVYHVDPHQRHMLEVSFEAFDDACMTSPGYLQSKNVAVLIGCSGNDWSTFLQHNPIPMSSFSGPGVSPALLSNRVSYSLHLRGPSLTVDTACSSSLVALDAARRLMVTEECDIAIAGGVQLILTPEMFVQYCKAKMLSPGCRCRTFDASADGYVRSEGCGAVVLQRVSSKHSCNLQSAYAWLAGTAQNHVGRSASLTAPNGPAQQAVMRAALKSAGLSRTNCVAVVETHGTGTALGDPIEVGALQAVYSEGHGTDMPLLLGALKSCMGHCEGAAGIAGLIKLVLSLQHKMVTPNLHLHRFNPHIDVCTADNKRQFLFPSKPCTLQMMGCRTVMEPLVGCVSSFGFGGSNAHAVVEVAEGTDEYKDVDGYSDKNDGGSFCSKLIWLFTGQGSQYAGMGRQLYEEEPVFRETVSACSRFLEQEGLFLRSAGGTLEKILYGEESCDKELADRLLAETEYSQVAIFVVELAISRMLQMKGILPSAVLGHSLGEYVAATVAGVLEWKDALKVVVQRARFMAELPRMDGVMAACRLSAHRVREALSGKALYHLKTVALAADNGPQSVVISGSRYDVEEALDYLGVRSDAKFLNVSHAYHSPLMAGAVTGVQQLFDKIKLSDPVVPYASTVLGHVASTGDLTNSSYWSQQVVLPVRFFEALSAVAVHFGGGSHIFVEIGPRPILTTAGQRCLRSSGRQAHQWISVIDNDCPRKYPEVLQKLLSQTGKHLQKPTTMPRHPWAHRRFPWYFAPHPLIGPKQRIEGGALQFCKNVKVQDLYSFYEGTPPDWHIAPIEPIIDALVAVGRLVLHNNERRLVSTPAVHLKDLCVYEETHTPLAKLSSLNAFDEVELNFRTIPGLQQASMALTGRYHDANGLPVSDRMLRADCSLTEALDKTFTHTVSLPVLLSRFGKANTHDGRLACDDDMTLSACSSLLKSVKSVVKVKNEALVRIDGNSVRPPPEGYILHPSIICDLLFVALSTAENSRPFSSGPPLTVTRVGAILVPGRPHTRGNLWAYINVASPYDTSSRGTAREALICLYDELGSVILHMSKVQLNITAQCRAAQNALDGKRTETENRNPLIDHTKLARQEAEIPTVCAPAARTRAEIQPENVMPLAVAAVKQILGGDVDFLPDAPLQALGIDSLAAVELRDALQRIFDVKLPATLLFDYPTVNALVKFITGHPVHKRFVRGSEPLDVPDVLAGAAPDARGQVAVVGVSCRFPGSANDSEEFWEVLSDSVDCICSIPESRFDLRGLFDPDPDSGGMIYVREGGFIDGAEQFDNSFFGISAAEAREMDPRQRVSLEVSFEACEDACVMNSLATSAEIFVAVGKTNTDSVRRDYSALSAYSCSGANNSILSNRISYCLGFTGSSLTIDAACASSLVALTAAFTELTSSQCNTALIVGVNLLVTPECYVEICRATMLSPDCRCKTFDATANGYVRSEGCGAVVLRRLAGKLTGTKERLYAVLRGTAANHVGRSASLTAPNGPAQQAVMRAALKSAGLSCTDRVAVVETHGTGTALGDPIEVGALQAVYGSGQATDMPLLLGAVKSCIGHTEGAAGIAGLIKLIMVLKYRIVTPNLHLRSFNTHIEVSTADGRRPFLFPSKSCSLAKVGCGEMEGSIVGCVSSFGFGGSNAHAILEVVDAPEHHMVDFEKVAIQHGEPLQFSDTIWLFGGKYSRFVWVGSHLYTGDAVFREAVSECSDYLARQTVTPEGLDETLADILYPKDRSDQDAIEHQVAVTGHWQVLAFVIEYAASRSLQARGIMPSAVLGHSVGEYAAGVTAGVLNWKDALRLVAHRARFMTGPPQEGVLAACRLSASRARLAFSGTELSHLKSVAVAADLGPQNVIVSGTGPEVERALTYLGVHSTAEIFSVFHSGSSPLTSSAATELQRLFGEIQLSDPRVPYVSTALGRMTFPGELKAPSYWARHIVQSAPYGGALRFNNKLALGSKSIVSAREKLSRSRVMGLNCLLSNSDGKRSLGMSLHKEFMLAHRKLVSDGSLRHRNHTEVEQLRSRRHWRHRVFPWASSSHPLLGVQEWSGNTPTDVTTYRVTVREDVMRDLRDHVILGLPLLPGAAFVDSMLAIGYDLLARHETSTALDQGVSLLNVKIFAPLVLPAPAKSGQVSSTNPFPLSALQICHESRSTMPNHEVMVTSRVHSDETNSYSDVSHARATLKLQPETRKVVEKIAVLDDLVTEFQYSPQVSIEEMYSTFRRVGWQYGPTFQTIACIQRRQADALVRLQSARHLPPSIEAYVVHPALLDGLFQTAGILLLDSVEKGFVYVPVGIEELTLLRRPPALKRCWGHVALSPETDAAEKKTKKVNCTLYDSGGEICAVVKGLLLSLVKSVDLTRGIQNNVTSDELWITEWRRLRPLTALSTDQQTTLSSQWWLLCGVPTEVVDQVAHWLEIHCEHLPAQVYCAPELASDTVASDVLQRREWKLIIHVGGLNPASHAERCMTSMLSLLQGLMLWTLDSKGRKSMPPTILVSSSIHFSSEGVASSLTPLHAGVLGLCRTAKLEMESFLNESVPLHYLDTDHRCENFATTCEALKVVFTVASQLDTIAQSTQVAVTGGAPRVCERELAVRSDSVYVPRLLQFTPSHAIDSTEAVFYKRMNGTFLVTGGLGGLGLVLTKWLAQRKVQAVVLLSRTGRPTLKTEQSEDWKQLVSQTSTTQVATVKCDVANKTNLKSVLQALQTGALVCSMTSRVLALPPLRGVFHAAGVLDDRPLRKQDRDSVNAVFAPKVQGAWNLHEALEELHMNSDLAFFVMFSSVAALVGNAGQANYAAANACLDALAQYRRSKGLAGQSIQWGPWTEQGMAADLKDRLARVGFGGITNEAGLKTLEFLLLAEDQRASVVACQQFLWGAFFSRYPACIPGLFEFHKSLSFASPKHQQNNLMLPEDAATALGPIMEVEEHKAYILAKASASIKKVIGNSEEPPVDRPLTELGIDSLGAVELRNALQNVLRIKLPATLLFDHPTLDSIAEYVVSLLRTTNSVRYNAQPFSPEEVLNTAEAGVDRKIAVTGMACRLPGSVSDPESLWSMLRSFSDCIKEIPPSRFDVDEFYDPDPDKRGTIYARCGGFLDSAEAFDNAFFGISEAEALEMDPRQRLSLEVSYEAFQNSGQTHIFSKSSAVGVYVGAMNHDKLHEAMSKASSLTATGAAISILSNRLSYVYNLVGPSITVDTACSSSLVAADYARKDMDLDVCTGALVVGTNLITTPQHFLDTSRSRMLSADCRCRTFDASASGYVRGEGCAAVFLQTKRTQDREASQVLAWLAGTSSNHVGRSASLTAPNGPAQQAVIRAALRSARVDKTTSVIVVETHGTGTALGDPIEVGALQAVYGSGSCSDTPLVLGALKSRIGHTEGAAGLAGLIKLILCLRHRAVPPNLHLKRFNSHIEISTSDQSRPFLLPTKNCSLETFLRCTSNDTLFGAVSSFGFGGSNAHAIVEIPKPPVSWPESAESVNNSKGGEHKPPSIWLFTGQGSQYVNMARNLYENDAVFKTTVQECSAYAEREHLLPSNGPSNLEKLIYPDPEVDLAVSERLLEETLYSQIAIFTVELAIGRMLQAVGLFPSAVLGHSLGEYAAATIAGVMKWEDALKVVAHRARVMAEQPKADGIMAACRLSAEEVQEALSGSMQHLKSVALAADNGPRSVVISGCRHDVEQVLQYFGVSSTATYLNVSHAFHSPLMSGAVSTVQALFEGVELCDPVVPIFSTVLGRLASAEEVKDPSYWAQQVVLPVLFRKAFNSVYTGFLPAVSLFFEVGPKKVLSNLGLVCARLSVSAQPVFWSPVDAPITRLGRHWLNAIEKLANRVTLGHNYQWAHRNYPLTRFSRNNTSLRQTAESWSIYQSTTSCLWREAWIEYETSNGNNAGDDGGESGEWIFAGVPAEKTALLSQSLKELNLASSRICAWGSVESVEILQKIITSRSWQGILVFCGLWSSVPEVESLYETIKILRTYAGLRANHEHLRLLVVTCGAQLGLATSSDARDSQVSPDSSLVPPRHAGLLGFCRTARLQLERLCRRFVPLQYIDVGEFPAHTQDHRVLSEIIKTVMRWAEVSDYTSAAPGNRYVLERQQFEGEILVRRQSFFVPRIVPWAVRSTAEPAPASSEKVAVITGGLGGVGLAVAVWLLGKGVSKVVLASRSGEPTADMRRHPLWLELQADGYRSRVICHKCDVSDIEQVRLLFTVAWREGAIGEIYHCAGLEGKASLEDIAKADVTSVYDAKVVGAWNLHRVCEEMHLDPGLNSFVLFSSISALPGNDAFSVYAAANWCLDALAECRRRLGRPAKSIQWGPWLDVGMAARNFRFKRIMTSRGLEGFQSTEALEILTEVLRAQDCASLIALRVQWKKYANIFGLHIPAWLDSALLQDTEVGIADRGRRSSAQGNVDFVAVSAAVQRTAAAVCGRGIPISENTKLASLGLDSLGAVELRNSLQQALNVRLPATLLVEYSTLKEVAAYIVEKSAAQHIKMPSRSRFEQHAVSDAASYAVVGMGCRIPRDARTPEEFWQMLIDEVDSVVEIPMDRFNIDAFFDPDPEADKCYVREAALLKNPDLFDNEFFNLTEKEVLSIDPQQRMLLEVAYEAFLEGGFPRNSLTGRDFGVFCAAYNNDFQFTNLTRGKSRMCVDNGEGCIPSLGEATGYPEPGGFMCFIPNRVSYSFGITGPSVGIDAACASALVAFDAAVTKLKRSGCSGALVGGVNLILSPTFFLGGCKARQFSRAGRCKTFDRDADGLVRGEGCGAVFLLPLAVARKKKLFVHSIVRGSATSHYGQSSRLTAPNTRSLARVLRLALDDAQALPSDTRYYEAHGTATVLGDIIEMTAVKEVFQPGRDPRRPLHMGTVHNNIGHLDAAAGIVAFIKTTLCLKHKHVPANIHFTTLHPEIQGINETLIKYTRDPQQIAYSAVDAPLLGANLAYGMGGSVAAVITEAGDEESSRATAVVRPEWKSRPFPLDTQQFVFLMAWTEKIALDDTPAPQEDVVRILQYLESSALNVRYLETLLPAKRCDDVHAVFLTGATGLIGAQLLLHLLQKSPKACRGGTRIYCLIRAHNHMQGLRRIRDSLMSRNIPWNFEYEGQIIPVIGDLEARNMGVSDTLMDHLQHTIDVVYHAADSVDFSVPYENLRRVNVLSILPILKLCTTHRAKPLHVVSNFAPHLQYFCAFTNDLDVPITECISPSLTAQQIGRLEQQMPPGVIGYPWCKWALEETLGRMKTIVRCRFEKERPNDSFAEFVSSKLPICVYRIPNSCVYYTTGYTDFRNASLSLTLAAIKERMVPPGVLPVGGPFLTSPVDICAGVVVSLSRKDARTHDVYNVVSLQGVRRQQLLKVAQWIFGSVSSCSVDDFLRRVDRDKELSPARDLRAPMRYWRRYWFAAGTDRELPVPISTYHVEKDLPGALHQFPKVEDVWLRMLTYSVKNYNMVKDPFCFALSFGLLKRVATKAVGELDWKRFPAQTQASVLEASKADEISDLREVQTYLEDVSHKRTAVEDTCSCVRL